MILQSKYILKKRKNRKLRYNNVLTNMITIAISQFISLLRNIFTKITQFLCQLLHFIIIIQKDYYNSIKSKFYQSIIIISIKIIIFLLNR